MRRLGAVLLLVALVAAGCGDEAEEATDAAGDTASSIAGDAKPTIKIEAKTDAFNGEIAKFFPAEAKVHAGDTVDFELQQFSGVPHTVTLGTIIDTAVAKYAALGPTASIEAQETSPEALAAVDPFPHGEPKGPPMLNQSAAQPCFLATGKPPAAEGGGAPACAKTEQPAFDGKQAFFNSGIIDGNNKSFEVKLADSIAPGTYNVMCLIHRGTMTTKLTVVPKDTPASAADVAAAADAEIAKLVTALTGPAKAGETATAAKAEAGTGDPQNYPGVVVAQFGPKEVSIPVGGTVTWSVFAFHTITFNAADSDIGTMSKAADGSWQLNPKLAPEGIKAPAAAGLFPPPDNAKPVLVDGGKWDGTGFRSTGLLASLPPQFVSFKQTFTKAGTYQLQCLVHPDMKGSVKVG